MTSWAPACNLVRRLPSPDELALMAKLIGEIRTAEAADTLSADSTLSPSPSPTSGGGEPGQTPNAPLPDPFTLASLLSLGFIRRGTEAGSTTASTSAAESLIAANPTLVNGNFAEAHASGQVADGWSSYGAVALQSGAAVLRESAKAQTNLSQTFVIGEHDRFLRFTVSDLGLNQVADGPQDAFEVALLNAGTFAPITATINLSHADALLNIQEDGTQRRIDTLQRIVNADGSSTYMLDLRGIAAGTAVTLSFDLLGFGAQDSHVAIRDVRLVNLPETRDDEVATAEDMAITIAALANDTDADLERGFLPEVMSAAQHGVVTVNADGTFSYAPATDFYGTDAFSYRLSDGQNHSNTATVAMTVAPVNDAPVSQASEVTTAEDTPLVIALSPLASDVDSATLTPSIVTGPQHGTLVQNADGSYTYTPDSNYNGPDAFSYKVNDDELDSNVSTVSINVTAVNDAPIANSDEGNAIEDGGPVTLNANQLLANDLDVDSNDSKTIIHVTNATSGAAVRLVEGNVVYASAQLFQQLALGETTTDSFSYTMADSAGAVSTATVTLTITGQNDAAVTTDDAAAVSEDADLAATGNLLANDSDVDNGTILTIAEPGSYTGTYGTLTLAQDGSSRRLG